MTSRGGMLVLLAMSLALAGCASTTMRRARPGVPVDSRPSPSESAIGNHSNGSTATNPDSTGQSPAPVGSVMTAEERHSALARIVVDTTAAAGAVRKCGTRNLLPDQASVLETTRNLLEQARAALASNELWRAESLARKARQLAASLDCPG